MRSRNPFSVSNFHKNYDSISADEEEKAKEFVLLEEYEFFYVYGKYTGGKLLYRETFSKFDVDRAQRQPQKLPRKLKIQGEW